MQATTPTLDSPSATSRSTGARQTPLATSGFQALSTAAGVNPSSSHEAAITSPGKSSLFSRLHHKSSPRTTSWYAPIDMSKTLGLKGLQSHIERGAAKIGLHRSPHKLSTMGRGLPPLTPHGIGLWFDKPIGNWPDRSAKDARTNLPQAIVTQLHHLNHLTESKQVDQLHAEITAHWHCLSEVEMSQVLEKMVSRHPELLKSDKPEGSAVQQWLERTLLYANQKGGLAQRLVSACNEKAQPVLQSTLTTVQDPAYAKVVTDRFHHLRIRSSVTNQFDVMGFLQGTNFEVATIPAEKRGTRVLVVGAGPTGVTLSHLLNRMGFAVKLVDANGHVGGRLKTNYLKRSDGTLTPTFQGGMRASEDNNIFTFANEHDHPTVPMPNPGDSLTAFIQKDRVYSIGPGQTLSPTQTKVKADYERAIGSILNPMLQAREGGDAPHLWNLVDQVEKEFDAHTFKTGLDHLLAKIGVQWTPEERRTFDEEGIGVGSYAPYNHVGFLDIFQFKSDRRLDKQRVFTQGMDKVFQSVLHDNTPLKDGSRPSSLMEQGALRLNTALERIDFKEADANGDRKPVVQLRDTTTGELLPPEEFDKVACAIGMWEAEALGLLELTSPEIAQAARQANKEPAIKLSFTVPAAKFDEITNFGNFQFGSPSQQLYVFPRTEGSDVQKLQVYSLGNNARECENHTAVQFRDLLVTTLRAPANDPNVQGNPADIAKHSALADLIMEHTQDPARMEYDPWAKAPHIHTAFKMDLPNQRGNSGVLESAATHQKDNVIMSNEMWARDGSGFITTYVPAVMAGNLAESVGGTHADNSAYQHARMMQSA